MATAENLHILFFPFMAHGHVIPTVAMADLFASHDNVTATIATTPLNAPLVASKNPKISIATVQFPPAAGLPAGCENMDQIAALRQVSGDRSPAMAFLNATEFLRQPLEDVVGEIRPDCLVADMFFPWATEVAGKFGIPRLVFHGTGVFSLGASESLRRDQPEKRVSSDFEEFVIPSFPGEIKMRRSQVPNYSGEFPAMLRRVRESETASFGVVVNSFYGLESVYVDHFRGFSGRTAWLVGPLCLRRGNRGSPATEHDCLKWLDSKEPGSVIYVCFGSVVNLDSNQLVEIAKGLESIGDSGIGFVWVVRWEKSEESDWLPEGFEDRMAGKGIIVRGWAPQVEILEHAAVGGFVTHCGWNSILEGVSAGVPMVTWPVSAEQFYNEKLVTNVLGIGVGVGAERWIPTTGDFVAAGKVEAAVRALMGEDEAAETRRRKAAELGAAAREAVEEGGSSDCDLKKLIRELRAHRSDPTTT